MDPKDDQTENFICRNNIARYRRLLEATTDSEQRLVLINLLAAEEARLDAINGPSSIPPQTHPAHDQKR